jgi:ABC-type uncharacterized transport system permease subunit
MRLLFASIIAALGFVLAMIGMDVFAHNQTFHEAFKGLSHQAVDWLSQLFVLAWQYKFVTIVFFAIVIAAIYIRQVPEIKHQ